MEQTKYDVFISYSRKDTEIAERICAALQNNGITYFIDRQGIGGGMEFPVVLAQAIRNSELFLFLASKNSYSSKFTINEITYAFNKKERNQILPYIIDGSSLPEDLEFVFAGINWRIMQQHPIDKILIPDLLKLLGRNNKCQPIKGIVDSITRISDNKKQNGYNLVLFEQKGRYGYKDKRTGTVIVSCKLKYAESFREGLARIEDENGKCGYIDETGNIVIPCIWKSIGLFSEGLANVKDDNGKCGYINKTGKVVIACKWNYAAPFKEGRAYVTDTSGMMGFIDITGKLVIPCQWKSVFEFSEGLALAKGNNGKWGYIDKNGRVIISYQWKTALPFKGGIAVVEDENGKNRKIDKVGKIL